MENELIGDFQSQKQGLQSIRRKNRNQCAGKKRFGNKHDLTPMTIGTTVKGLHRRNSQNAYHHYGNTVIMKDPAVCYPSENGGFSRAASIQNHILSEADLAKQRNLPARISDRFDG